MIDLSNENIIHVKGKNFDYIQFRRLLELNVKHAYTLKNDKLNFRRQSKLRKSSFELLSDELKFDKKNIISPNQTHTNIVKCVENIKEFGSKEEIDGLLTNEKDLVLSTTNADCILYLLYDKNKKVCGSIHSGWRGTYQRIIENAVKLMVKNYNSNVEDILVCICPSIRKCHFEVECDVKDMFERKFEFTGKLDEIIFDGNLPGKYYIDTVHLNNILLQNIGIKEENIIDSNICSVCNSELINSYRTMGKVFATSTAAIWL